MDWVRRPAPLPAAFHSSVEVLPMIPAVSTIVLWYYEVIPKVRPLKTFKGKDPRTGNLCRPIQNAQLGEAEICIHEMVGSLLLVEQHGKKELYFKKAGVRHLNRSQLRTFSPGRQYLQ